MPRLYRHTAPTVTELDELRELSRRAGVPMPRNLDYELTRTVLRMRCLYRLRQQKVEQMYEWAQPTRTLKTPIIDVRKRAANDHD